MDRPPPEDDPKTSWESDFESEPGEPESASGDIAFETSDFESEPVPFEEVQRPVEPVPIEEQWLQAKAEESSLQAEAVALEQEPPLFEAGSIRARRPSSRVTRTRRRHPSDPTQVRAGATAGRGTCRRDRGAGQQRPQVRPRRRGPRPGVPGAAGSRSRQHAPTRHQRTTGEPGVASGGGRTGFGWVAASAGRPSRAASDGAQRRVAGAVPRRRDWRTGRSIVQTHRATRPPARRATPVERDDGPAACAAAAGG